MKKLTVILAVCFLIGVFMPVLSMAKDQESVIENKPVVTIKEKPVEPKTYRFFSLEDLLATLIVEERRPYESEAYFEATFKDLPLGWSVKTVTIEAVPEYIEMTERIGKKFWNPDGKSYFFESIILTEHKTFWVDARKDDGSKTEKEVKTRIRVRVEPYFELPLQKQKNLAQLIKKAVEESTPLLFEATFYCIKKLDPWGNLYIDFQITDARKIE